MIPIVRLGIIFLPLVITLRMVSVLLGIFDDFRVYGIALTEFEVEMIYREAEGSSLNVGEGSYSVSAFQ